ncbi:protein grindelwald isoform X1 [Aphidius gifuensis]|uniref:protein grindelwald isoform X1 n=1 Tax=Aphidius gifuensis TaxID=684658 RepID=UPI001CDD80E4|nr:protein grindelwald isoform X1 [Aphidius gifuensis]
MGKIEYKKMFYKLLVGLFLVGLVGATLDDPEGVKCGQKKCTIMEYCSPYDQQCRPCSNICDTEDHNHQADLCAKDCQVYLHDQRYVLRSELGQNGILRDPQIQSLWTIIKIISTVTALLFIIVLFFIIRDYVQFKRFRGKFGKIFGKTWKKKTLKNNKIHDDVETGSSKQQQQQQQQQKTLKLSMPTISASITSPTVLTTSSSSSQETNSSNGTPNTTSTPLSKRHPSEDTTLDYAYDNPAMTPSPETVQSRSKRESSF